MAYYNPYRKRNYQTIKHRSPYEKTEAQKRLEAAEAAKRKEEEKPNFAVRSLATVGDVLANVYTGAVKGVEGVVDLLIGATGAVGGLVGDDFQDAMESAVKYDFAGKAAGGDYLQELTKYSYTNDGKVGEIVENIANGVGQMLPTVAAAMVTGGTSLGAQGAQAAGMIAASVSAAGSATESALNDGAGYYQALGYGATMGAVEGATEKLLGGVDVKAIKGIGKELAKEAGEEIAEQGGKRILKGMLEEAGEEAVAELVDPLARTMYQGGEALGDYLTPEYWQGVGEAALVGGLTGAAYSGTVGHWIHKAKGTNADMDASFETVESLQKQQRKLYADDKLDGKQYSDIQSNIKGNMENVSKVLKKASPEKRAKLIEKYRIDSMFDENGDMRADYAQMLDRQIEAGKRGNMSPYVSPDLAADEERLNADLEALNNDRAEGEAEVRLFDGELSAEGKKYFNDLKRAENNLSAIAGGELNVSLVNGDVNFKGVTVKGNNIYINAELVENGTWAKTLVHELTHFTEGSPEYVKFMQYLLSDKNSAAKKMSELTSEGNPYGFTRENVERVSARMDDNSNTDGIDGKRVLQYSKNENFTEEIDEWSKDGRPEDGYFVLGMTGDVLQGLGAIESDIYMLSDKINTILQQHPEMTLDEIKKLPDILEDPVLILKSRNVGRGERANTRLIVFGNIKAKNGQPILSVLDLRPNEKNLIIDDMQKLTSAYTKTQNPIDFIQNSDIVYADKKRTTPLLRTIGFQMPIELNESGSIGSISYNGQNVNIFGKSFSEIVNVNVSKKTKNTAEGNAYGFTRGNVERVTERVNENAEQNSVDKEPEVQYSLDNENSNKYDYSKAFAEKDGTIEQRLYDNAKSVVNMKNVSQLTGKEFSFDGKSSLKDRVVAFFNSFKNSVESDELGKVAVTLSSFRDDKGHGLTYNKVVSFAAIPEVIKNGKVIDIWQPEGKPYQRITLAAPISIAGEKYYMGVMIQKDNQSQRMYLHDVIAEKATLSFTTEPTTQNGEGIRDKSHLFITSILQKALNVNRFSKKERVANQSSTGLSRPVGNAMKNNSSINSISQNAENVNTNSENNSMNESDPEFVSELIAGLAEDSVGSDGAFIDKLVRGNDKLCAKILNKIEDMTAYLASRKTPEARAQYKSLKHAEKLFMNALKATGKSYRNGRIIGAVEEEEEKLQYSIKYPVFSEEQLQENIKAVASMDTVKTIDADKLLRTGKRPSDIFSDFFKSLDENIYSDTFGDIALKKSSVKSEVRHGITSEKIASIEAIPDVIEKGKVIHFKAKEAGVERIIVSAPIDIGDKKYLMGVMLQRDAQNQRLYLHNVIIKEEGAQSSEVDLLTTGTLENDDRLFITSILQNVQKVNTKLQYSKKSQGQRAQNEANTHRQKVYTKQDARSVISTIVSEHLNTEDGYFGKLIGKSRDAAIESLWLDFNKSKPSEKVAQAYKLADYIIQNATLEGMETTPETELAMERVSVLRDYMRKFDLSGIREEIKHVYDKDSRAISLLWGKREGGISPDSIVAELEEKGIIISAENPADIMFEIHELYRSSRDAIRQEGERTLKEALDQDEYAAMRQKIVREIVGAHTNKGKPSTLATVSNNYEKILKRMKGEFREVAEKNKLRNRVIYIFNQIKEQKKGAFVAASEYQNRAFKEGFEKLTSTLWRGNLREDKAVRAEIKKVYEWYIDPENRLFHNEKGEVTTLYNATLADALNTLGNGEGRFSLSELKAFEFVAETVKHMIDTYNKVWDGEKWIDTKTEAKRYVRRIEANRRYRARQLYRFAAIGKYNRMFLDNASVFRAADCYEDDGFFTEAFESLRRGLIGMQIAEADMREKAEDFYKRNRNYVKRLTKEEIEYKGKKLTVAQFISLYMTAKRKQSHLALAKTGFKCADKKGDAIDFGALASDPEKITTEEQASALVAKMRSEMESSLTKQDMEYIAVLEEIYRMASELKIKTDMVRWGYSNALKSYYYPIKRADQAKNADVTFFDEMMATDMTFNRDTVKNAARLYVEPVNTVFDRHIHGVALYSNLALTLESITRVINVNVSDVGKDSITKRVGDERYLGDTYKALEKLIGDIKGMRVTGDEGFSKLWSRVRSNYAKATLAANPKIFATQLSSFFAATSILEYKNIVKGFGVSDKFKDVDKYCSLAKLRNTDNTVVKAQTLSDRTGKVSDVLLTPVGKIDRWVVVELFGGCQAQIEAEGGAKIGTEENKIAAGKLLERVILETQQNALVTERSQAMRSEQEYLKFLTMFSADAMKVVGRVVDSIGEISVLRAKKKDFKADPNKNAAEIAALEKERAKLAAEIEEYRKSADVVELDLSDELQKEISNATAEQRGKIVERELKKQILQIGEYTLEDGTKAILDNTDIRKIGHSKYEPKNRASVLMDKLTKYARLESVADNVEHHKFVQFKYYKVDVKIGESLFECTLNVGLGKFDNRYHIYDINQFVDKNKSGSPILSNPRKSVEQTVSRTTTSTDSIPQNSENVNSNFENDIDELQREISSIDAQIKKLKSEPRDIDGKIKRANGKARRAIAALTAQSVFMAAIALAFKWLYAKTKDKEKEEIIADTAFDFVGNMLGGLPLWRDVYSCISDGFEVDIFNMSVVNNFLDSCVQCWELVTDAASGDDITTNDALAKVKKLGVALGPLFGLPVRNTYNLVTGVSKRFFPRVGYNIESVFEAQPYSSDLKKAIENGDERMVATIAGLMTKESIGSQSKSVQSALSKLVGQGYDVLPRSLGDTVTYGGQLIELTAAQKKRFRKLYDISDQSVEELVRLSQFKATDDKIKAKALRFIYDTYWQLALADILETDEANKNVLFAEAIDIEKLALIISTARTFEADKDKNGNAVAGSKKKKVMDYIESLNMSAAEKYMIAGYLGYRNLKGQDKVEAYISKLSLTKQEKTKLLEYSGYDAA